MVGVLAAGEEDDEDCVSPVPLTEVVCVVVDVLCAPPPTNFTRDIKVPGGEDSDKKRSLSFFSKTGGTSDGDIM